MLSARGTPSSEGCMNGISSRGHNKMNILSFNPGWHDGAIVYVKGASLVLSIEAEKNSNYRYSPMSTPAVFDALGEFDEIPDVICASGWWFRDHYEYLHGSRVHVGYRGLSKTHRIVDQRQLLGRPVR